MQKHPYQYPDSVRMRSYNPTTSGHKGQIKRGLKALLAAKKPVTVDDAGPIATSFPVFEPLMRSLGALFERERA